MHPERCQASVYVDDIVMSGRDSAAIGTAIANLTSTASDSGFVFNASKIKGPAEAVEAFNICLSNGDMRVSDRRMAEFGSAVRGGDPRAAEAIIRYVRTVNQLQAADLAVLGLGP
jgi:hypothetical protein